MTDSSCGRVTGTRCNSGLEGNLRKLEDRILQGFAKRVKSEWSDFHWSDTIEWINERIKIEYRWADGSLMDNLDRVASSGRDRSQSE
jgi:hypothetical protein